MGERDRQFEQLSAYLDGEVSPAEARQLERAMQADEPLAAELARLRRLRQLLRSLPAEHAPDDFVARVLEQAERSRLVGKPAARAKAAPFRWVGYLATAAVLVVAVGVGALIVKTFQTTTIEEMAAPVVEVAREDVADLKPKRDVPEGAGAGGPPGPIPAPAASYTPEHFRKGGAAAGVDAAGVLRHFGKAGTAVDGDGGVPNWYINTDNLSDTRREVEAALARNGLVRLACDTRVVETRDEARARLEVSNVYQVNLATPKQVQLLVLVEQSQVPRLKDEVVAIQARQRVRQDSIAAETLDRMAAARHRVAAADQPLLERGVLAMSPAPEREKPARPAASGMPLVAKAEPEVPSARAPETQQPKSGRAAIRGVKQDGIYTGDKARLEAAKPVAAPATRPAEGADARSEPFRTINGPSDELAARIVTAEKAADKKLGESSGQIATEVRQRGTDEGKYEMGLRIPEKTPSPEQTPRSIRRVFEPPAEPGAAQRRLSQMASQPAASMLSSQPATVVRLGMQRQAAGLQALLITLNDTRPEQPGQPSGPRRSLWKDLGRPTTTQAAEPDQNTSAPAGEPNSPK